MEFLLLIIGLAGLWLASELVIKGATAIARHYNLSELFVGLTILAIGTDLPELFVSVSAAMDRLQGIETSGLVIGNAVGSVFSQMALVLGIAGSIATIKVVKREIIRDGLFMIVSILLLFFLGSDGLLSRVDALIMLSVYAYYLIELFREERVVKKTKKKPSLDLAWSIMSLLGGLGLLIFASEITIESALGISKTFGIGQRYVGALIVGLGTSLPELATATAAIRNNSGKLAVGNILGSNIYDLLFMLGAGAVISEFVVDQSILIFDVPALLFVSIVTVYFMATNKALKRREAQILIGSYILYFVLSLAKSFS